jgi:DNA invertase Pin-like site-specific DNA recombinase
MHSVILPKTTVPIPSGSRSAFPDLTITADLRKERQLEDIAKAKAQGIYRGGTRQIDRDTVLDLQSKGFKPAEIATKLKIGRALVYRILQE